MPDTPRFEIYTKQQVDALIAGGAPYEALGLSLDEASGLYRQGEGVEGVVTADPETGELPPVVEDRIGEIARFAPAKAHETAILFGTSLEAQNGRGWNYTDPEPGNGALGRGWWTWFNAYLGQPLAMVRNAGVGGNTYGQMVARMNTDVLSTPSDWVFIGPPANDWGQTVAPSTTIANLETMLAAILAAGRKVAVQTFVPRGDMDAPMRARASAFRDHVLTMRGRRGVVVLDTFGATTDPATFQPIAGSTVTETPAIHYSEVGAHRLGRVVAAEFAAQVPLPPSSTLDGMKRSFIENPSFRGGSGWSTTTGGDPGGTVATTYGGGRAQVDISGMTVPTNDAGIFHLESIASGRWAVGDVVQLSAWVEFSGLKAMDSASRCAPLARLFERFAGGGFGKESLGFSVPSSQSITPQNYPENGRLLVRTPRMTIQPGIDRLYVYLGWYGATAVSLEFSDVRAVKV